MDEARGGPAQGGDGAREPGAAARSPYRTTCPYFRRETPERILLAPLERPDPANRCTAIGSPLEPSLRQQAMACLSPEHDACPRYIHAEAGPRPTVPRPAVPRQEVLRQEVGPQEVPPPAVVRVEAPPPEPRSLAPLSEAAAPRPRSRATLAAFLLLLGSIAASVAFVMGRGGLTMLAPTPAPNEVAAATGTPAATAVAVAATVAPTPTALPTPIPTAVPTTAPTPAATATPRPTKRATPRPTSERYAYLVPCPSKPDCWIYTIRRGDALYNLARYFGHPIETIYRLNPWTKVRGIQPGDKLILPPPTL